MSKTIDIAIIGAGPAGLFAAECLSSQTCYRVTVYEAKPSAGRKFLVAGKSGLNLTNDAAEAVFLSRYQGESFSKGLWQKILTKFGKNDLCAWSKGLGQETKVSSGKKIFPECWRAAPLLRSWLQRLGRQGVVFKYRHRLLDLNSQGMVTQLDLESQGERVRVKADAVILALGGGSWSRTGSDGSWQELLRNKGVMVAELEAANCGWRAQDFWSDSFLKAVEGKPIKNARFSAGQSSLIGEAVVTRYGLEGGPIYQLGAPLRKMSKPILTIDFKPDFSTEKIIQKLESVRSNPLKELKQRLRLDEASLGLIEQRLSSEQIKRIEPVDLDFLVDLIKAFSLPLLGPQPIDEAISSAGGISFDSVKDSMELKALPHVYVAGEMLDWEAPTGGFLLQGCFSSAYWVAQAILKGKNATVDL